MFKKWLQKLSKISLKLSSLDYMNNNVKPSNKRIRLNLILTQLGKTRFRVKSTTTRLGRGSPDRTSLFTSNLALQPDEIRRSHPVGRHFPTRSGYLRTTICRTRNLISTPYTLFPIYIDYIPNIIN